MCLSDSTCTSCTRLEVPEQALGGIPLGLGLVVKISLEFSYADVHIYICVTGNSLQHVCSLKL